MIRDEAEKLSGALQEHLGSSSGLHCAVRPVTKEVEFNAPGGGRPRLVRYQIVVSGGGREAQLSLDEAEELLGAVAADPPAEQVFAQIAAVTGAGGSPGSNGPGASAAPGGPEASDASDASGAGEPG